MSAIWILWALDYWATDIWHITASQANNSPPRLSCHALPLQDGISKHLSIMPCQLSPQYLSLPWYVPLFVITQMTSSSVLTDMELVQRPTADKHQMILVLGIVNRLFGNATLMWLKVDQQVQAISRLKASFQYGRQLWGEVGWKTALTEMEGKHIHTDCWSNQPVCIYGVLMSHSANEQCSVHLPRIMKSCKSWSRVWCSFMGHHSVKVA